jgi:hypothetical protein
MAVGIYFLLLFFFFGSFHLSLPICYCVSSVVWHGLCRPVAKDMRRSDRGRRAPSPEFSASPKNATLPTTRGAPAELTREKSISYFLFLFSLFTFNRPQLATLSRRETIPTMPPVSRQLKRPNNRI